MFQWLLSLSVCVIQPLIQPAQFPSQPVWFSFLSLLTILVLTTYSHTAITSTMAPPIILIQLLQFRRHFNAGGIASQIDIWLCDKKRLCDACGTKCCVTKLWFMVLSHWSPFLPLLRHSQFDVNYTVFCFSCQQACISYLYTNHSCTLSVYHYVHLFTKLHIKSSSHDTNSCVSWLPLLRLWIVISEVRVNKCWTITCIGKNKNNDNKRIPYCPADNERLCRNCLPDCHTAFFKQTDNKDDDTACQHNQEISPSHAKF